jgi:hypothetical protein
MTLKNGSFFFTHSACLQASLLDEPQLPRSERWPGSTEDEVIPLFPN